MLIKKLLSLSLLGIFFMLTFSAASYKTSNGNKDPVYKNPNAPVEERVDDLLKRLTIDEKLDLLGGTGFETKEIKRLGIPSLNMSDGPLGVRWDESTAFPAGIALAASWQPELAERVGRDIADEVKAHGRHVILGPCVNIARIPQGGRNFESYGEDPYLTSRFAVDYIKGVQDNGVAATVKHFACNNQEFERMFVDVKVDERTLHEIYLPAFKAAVEEGKVLAVMSAYNKVNEHFASENDHLLLDILKKDWNFRGLVMSDWGAVHSSVPTANSGLDVEMPKGKYLNKNKLSEAIKNGEVSQTKIDDKIKRLLRVMFKIGLFDNGIGEGKINTQEHRRTAFEAARNGIVLLKNENNILPIDENNIKSIAVIGPNAANARTGGGGSSLVSPVYSVSPLEALQQRFGDHVKINYAAGVLLEGDASVIEPQFFFLPNSNEQGLKTEFFDNMNLSGNPVKTRIDKQINFEWGPEAPFENFKKDNFSARWTTDLRVTKSGEYVIDAISDDGVRLFINGEKVMENWSDHGVESKTYKINFEKDKVYHLKLEYYENGGDAVVKLGWSFPGEKLMKAAVKAASESDAAILFVGTSQFYETEGRDRDDLVLPANQDELIEEVAKANKNTIVVINSGSPVLMDKWINKVNGVLEAWFGGAETGNAIAEVLLGNYNPGGKLPMTFPHKWEDCSAYDTYKAEDSVTYFSDGIFVGYRHFDKKKIEPLFPFGYGLSYTTFEYGNLKVTPLENDNFKVTFDITNTGKREGEEAAQLYLHDEKSSLERPEKELKRFAKIFLKPGEKKTVELILDKDALSFYDPTKNQWIAEPGQFEVLIGSSSRDIKLKSTLLLN